MNDILRFVIEHKIISGILIAFAGWIGIGVMSDTNSIQNSIDYYDPRLSTTQRKQNLADRQRKTVKPATFLGLLYLFGRLWMIYGVIEFVMQGMP